MNERLNIRRMAVPEQQKESATFDVEKDISQHDWDLMVKQLNEQREGDKEWVPNLLSELKIMRPDDTRHVLPRDIKWLGRKVKSTEGTADWDEYLNCAFALKVLEPQRRLHSPGDMDLSFQSFLTRGSQGSVQHINLRIARDTFRARVIHPEWDYGYLDDELFRETIRELKEVFADDREDVVIHAAESAAAIRALYPNKDLEITNQNWKDMRTDLARYKSPDLFVYGISQLGAAMTILAADDVRITDQGLYIVRHTEKEMEKSIPTQPEPLVL
jgi:hypothetical protein